MAVPYISDKQKGDMKMEPHERFWLQKISFGGICFILPLHPFIINNSNLENLTLTNTEVVSLLLTKIARLVTLNKLLSGGDRRDTTNTQ